MSAHLILIGDSIFDNRSYTGGEPDVVGHLRSILPPGWQATLLAEDGTTTSDVAKQFQRVPSDATHLVLSLGGNDAILNSDLLAAPVGSSTEALMLFGDRIGRFESAYRAAVETLVGLGLSTTVCTIYNGNLEPDQAPLARIALMTFNDVILRVAFGRHLGVIDLRLVCTGPADYANAIEPSGLGGRKIAEAIARSVGAVPGGRFSRVCAE